MSRMATTRQPQGHSYWPVSSRSWTVPREVCRESRVPQLGACPVRTRSGGLALDSDALTHFPVRTPPPFLQPEIRRRAGSRKKNQWGNHVRGSANVGVSGAEVIGFSTAVKCSLSDHLPVSDNGRLGCRCHPSCRPQLVRSAIHASPQLSYLSVPLHQDHVQEI